MSRSMVVILKLDDDAGEPPDFRHALLSWIFFNQRHAWFGSAGIKGRPRDCSIDRFDGGTIGFPQSNMLKLANGIGCEIELRRQEPSIWFLRSDVWTSPRADKKDPWIARLLLPFRASEAKLVSHYVCASAGDENFQRIGQSRFGRTNLQVYRSAAGAGVGEIVSRWRNVCAD